MDMNLNFSCSSEQRNALLGLAYWIADARYIEERYGSLDPEYSVCDKTLKQCVFPHLDRLQVPFWVQNTVIAFSDDWRRYISEYLSDYLKKRNIQL